MDSGALEPPAVPAGGSVPARQASELAFLSLMPRKIATTKIGDCRLALANLGNV
jgi:hypothetical protein